MEVRLFERDLEKSWLRNDMRIRCNVREEMMRRRIRQMDKK